MTTEEDKDLLAIHYDDSSDEEDMQDGLEQQFDKYKEKFDKSLQIDPIYNNKHEELSISFTSYLYGLMLFNSKTVKDKYQKLKSNLLKSKGPSLKDEIISNWVADALYKSINEVIIDQLMVKEHPRASEKIIIQCKNDINLIDKIQGFIKIFLKYPRQLIRYAKYDDELPIEIIDALKKLTSTIAETIEVIAEQHLKDEDFTPPKPLIAADLLRHQEIRNIFEHKYKQYIFEINVVATWVRENKFLMGNLLTNSGKIAHNQKTMKLYKDIIIVNNTMVEQQAKENNGSAASNLLYKIIKDTDKPLTKVQNEYIKLMGESKKTCQEEFTTSFINDFLEKIVQKEIIDAEKSKGNQSILHQDNRVIVNREIEQSTFSNVPNLCDYLDMYGFIPFTAEQFRTQLWKILGEVELKDNFKRNLENSFKSHIEDNWSRETLLNDFTHSVSSCIDYIASLRITNRSTIRTCRNQANEKSILGDSKEENADYAWHFPASDKHHPIERNRLTKKARTALIPMHTNANAYNEIAKTINSLKKNIEVTDADIASWVRGILQCTPGTVIFKRIDKNDPISLSPKQQSDLELFMVQLAQLLGGTEKMRYPGAMIANEMMLDLIISNKLNWETALNPNNPDKEAIFLPMSIVGAVAVSRGLMTLYRKCTPYSYQYPGDNQESVTSVDTTKFIDAEKKLANFWLDRIKQEREAAGLGGGNITLAEAIKTRIPIWYTGL
ncbi:hypothetical protein [Rickettsiales endosymbiont of Stachyamoeba lipophora]|uniref:hypothetical protein n=1 Tax=Rickettsiales endosymbiont of Stachyamoeba lipophora TaxID=2486578 RepID=UPI000F6518FB|nr:hypothetical protein [Rickettsiales endosymbiont of Stachyamoeba lipophora]AZL16271.1 hypothetical protein EF513_06995 [Rickettsiales endosymbiont of Stachyamoeba lipophora]